MRFCHANNVENVSITAVFSSCLRNVYQSRTIRLTSFNFSRDSVCEYVRNWIACSWACSQFYCLRLYISNISIAVNTAGRRYVLRETQSLPRPFRHSRQTAMHRWESCPVFFAFLAGQKWVSPPNYHPKCREWMSRASKHNEVSSHRGTNVRVDIVERCRDLEVKSLHLELSAG